jgi:hypothetical protein
MDDVSISSTCTTEIMQVNDHSWVRICNDLSIMSWI